MEQHINFHIVQTWDNKMQFTGDDITITVSGFTYENNKHRINDPAMANAHFICCGKLYSLQNDTAFITVEDWYFSELLPKFQMLTLLTGIEDPVGQQNAYITGPLRGQN